MMQFTRTKLQRDNGFERWRQGRLFAAEGGDAPVARRVLDLGAEAEVGSDPLVIRRPNRRAEMPCRQPVLDVAELAGAMQKSRAAGTDHAEPLPAPVSRSERAQRIREAIGVAVAMACCVATAVLA